MAALRNVSSKCPINLVLEHKKCQGGGGREGPGDDEELAEQELGSFSFTSHASHAPTSELALLGHLNTH